MPDAGCNVSVSRTFPSPPNELWKLVTSEQGFKTWLGAAPRGRLIPGLRYRTRDGVSGEFRAIEGSNYLRLTWFLDGWERTSTLHVRLTPEGNETSLTFRQERLTGEMDRERMRRHWRDVLERLAEAVG